MATRLSNYPYVVVRIGCRYCSRRGEYRLARLAARLGPEADLDAVLNVLAADCAYQDMKPQKYRHGCGACFIDLNRNPTPPDLPPGLFKLRVVK